MDWAYINATYTTKVEETILRNKIFWFYSKFTTVTDFEFFFPKSLSFVFEKKQQFVSFWEFLLFQSFFAGGLLEFGDWKSQTQNLGLLTDQLANKHKKGTALSGWFSFAMMLSIFT